MVQQSRVMTTRKMRPEAAMTPYSPGRNSKVTVELVEVFKPAPEPASPSENTQEQW